MAIPLLLIRPPPPRVLPRPIAHARPEPAAGTSFSDVLAALSHALDLTSGVPAGHAVRSCVIGLRLADEIGLDGPTRASLAYALLLKDAGCSSNAARMSALFGTDERVVKPLMKAADWQRPLATALAAMRAVGHGRPLVERLRLLAGLRDSGAVTRGLIEIRCERGSAIALDLGLGAATAGAIGALDEHWNGGGYPTGLRGAAIPLLARIANLAQTIEAYRQTHGVAAAIRVARKRRGTWFDPSLVDRVARWEGDRAWWEALGTARAADGAAVVTRPVVPGGEWQAPDDASLDGVAEAFARIVDAKSPYTSRHSANVATFAVAIGRELGWDAAACRTMRRAGLLHDIGKLGVSNQILDKAGPLTPAERTAMEAHPLHTWEILSRVRAFAPFAQMASLHHERLDGTGYPWRFGADRLDARARVLAVADVYEALTADRPYRAGLTAEVAFAIIHRDRDRHLWGDGIDALAAIVERGDLHADAHRDAHRDAHPDRSLRPDAVA